MPIVIDEVQITIVSPESNAPGSSNNNAAATLPGREELVKECVEKVMEILQQKIER
ncbi:hypothetical protein BH10BAC3_BH10BAC3_08520 [soil metagenome]